MTTTLYALFDSTGRPEEAVRAVAAAGPDGLEVRVIEEMSAGAELGLPTGATPVPSNLASAGTAAALVSAQDELFAGSDLSDNQKAFLSRGVRQGGKLVMVQVPQASAGDVAHMLKEQGGRVLPD